MADFYTLWSEEIRDITPEEAEWIKNELKEQDDHPDSEGQFWPLFNWEFIGEDSSHLWFHSDESDDLEQLLNFVQRFIRKFRPEYVFRITWAFSCSKPRIGSFGGGWAVIGKDDRKLSYTDKEVENAYDEMMGVKVIENE